MVKIRFTLPIAFVGLLVFSTCASAAVTLDYYTYNGFLPVTEAFQKIALIFSSATYHDILNAVMYIALPIAGAVYFFRAWAAPDKNPLTHAMWAFPLLLLFTIYLSLFRATDSSIVVYDPILNRTQTIGNLPEGVVRIAGYLNRLEREMVQIVDTAGVPGRDYQDNAGGLGIAVVKSLENEALKIDPYMTSTLESYIQDCVYFELARPGTTLSHTELLRGGNNFLPSLAKAAHPAIFTVLFSAAHPEGISATCSDTNTAIQAYFSGAGFQDAAVKSACTQNGFDISSAVELNKCRNLINNTLTNVDNIAGFSSRDFVRQASISKVLYHVIKNSSTTSAMALTARRNVVTSGIGMGIAANEWLPIIKAIMTAICIGLLPFLIIFIPTPMGWKAISTISGLFVFLSIWGITDAVCHSAAMDYAAQVFGDLKISNLALEGMLNFPDLSVKTMAMFGQIRTGGIMLASVLSMMLVKFGGSAMAHMAGGLVGGVQTSGKQSGALATPEGRSRALDTQEQASGSLIYHDAANHNFNTSAHALANMRASNVGKGSAYANPTVAEQIGQQHEELQIGDTAGKTIANTLNGESNITAATRNAAVSQTKQSARARTETKAGGLDDVAARANVSANKEIGATEAYVQAAHNAGMSVKQAAYAQTEVDQTKILAGAQAELNTGDIRARATRNAYMAIGASAYVASLFKTNEAAAAFGEKLKGLELNTKTGQLRAASILQESLAEDGLHISTAAAQQYMAMGTSLNQAGGAGKYVASAPDNASNLVNAGAARTAIGVGAAQQHAANARTQHRSLEEYGRQGAQIQRGVTVDQKLHDELSQFKADNHLQNMQVPEVGGFVSAIHRDQDGHIIGIENATAAGSGSSRSFDTDSADRTATQKAVVHTKSGDQVQTRTGSYKTTWEPSIMFPDGGYFTKKFVAASGDNKSGINVDSVGLDASGNLAHVQGKTLTDGTVVDSATSRGSVTQINKDRVNVSIGADVQGVASGTAASAVGSLVEGVAKLTGSSDAEAHASGQNALHYTQLAVGTLQAGVRELSGLKSGLKQLGQGRASGNGSPGKVTQQQANEWKAYFESTGDISK